MLKWLLIITVSVLLSWQTPAFAGSNVAATTNDFVTRIQDEGYTVTKITRTWLGRILVTAHNDEFLREVVFNRRNGDVLRDSLFSLPGSGTRFASPNQSDYQDNEQMTSVGRALGLSENQIATTTGASPSDSNMVAADTSGTDTEVASRHATGDTGDTDSGNTDTGDTDAGDTDAGDTDAGDTDAGDTDAGDTDAGDTDAGDTGSDDGDTSGDSTD